MIQTKHAHTPCPNGLSQPLWELLCWGTHQTDVGMDVQRGQTQVGQVREPQGDGRPGHRPSPAPCALVINNRTRVES